MDHVTNLIPAQPGWRIAYGWRSYESEEVDYAIHEMVGWTIANKGLTPVWWENDCGAVHADMDLHRVIDATVSDVIVIEPGKELSEDQKNYIADTSLLFKPAR